MVASADACVTWFMMGKIDPFFTCQQGGRDSPGVVYGKI